MMLVIFIQTVQEKWLIYISLYEVDFVALFCLVVEFNYILLTASDIADLVIMVKNETLFCMG